MDAEAHIKKMVADDHDATASYEDGTAPQII